MCKENFTDFSHTACIFIYYSLFLVPDVKLSNSIYSAGVALNVVAHSPLIF